MKIWNEMKTEWRYDPKKQNKDCCDSELFNLCCIPQIFKLAGFMLLKSNYCAFTAPPKLALYVFSQDLPSLNLQYSKFSKIYS